ncbi:N-acetylmuramoyl-L-alanine amidase CwlD [Tepidimicrobium xylanilyticum]|uniref:N-acetylmuramoyl-L-alanine amidase n=1 Tax=Tepidimicrobium xylanilyticum TaxID=1123352 RepID=A0A1H2VIB9_9FIRM|nr:N-acetylmuramoyl-L-alanine amidase CwlD [Tepidimicrobium xylanilyticum]GMG96628.1 N-acetylmuramoyl-L-alanine amidase CwlD [Tepidimicrobium xylanilyticum]SDW68145.1 N-acetylmuramoyl-L-alanine amidase [Tepidimicrobium xylanilyticum]
MVFYIKKSHLKIILFLILLIPILIILRKNQTKAVYNNSMKNMIIGIDPGHGGVDPGAIGVSGIREDEINLKIGLKLKKYIEENGGKVIITRKTKDGLYTDKSKNIKEMKTEDLHRRKEIIEKGNCHLLVSIHLNAFKDPRYYGAQVFYKKGDETSAILANFIQDELRDTLDKDNRRVPQERDDIFLLNEMDIPSVLVECGFLSNHKEEKLLNTEEYQEKIAFAIYRGIMKYFNHGIGEYSF